MGDWTWELLLWSAKASGVILLVLGLRYALGSRLSASWRFALWGVVLVRLALPVLPASPVSLFHLLQVDSFTDRIPGLNALESSATEGTVPSLPSDSATGEVPWQSWLAASWLTGLWLVGALFLLSRKALAWHLLRRGVAASRPVEDSKSIELLETCRSRLGLARPVELRTTKSLTGPAVVGLARPVILIPESLFQDLPTVELGHILQHELQHIRRRDLWVRTLAGVLTIFHWFNPLVHVAFRQMETDCELACDSSVLRRLEGPDRAAYGHTLISLSTSSSFGTGALGMGGTARRQLERRIRMISKFKVSSLRHQIVGLTTFALLAAVALTDGPALAKTGAAAEKPQDMERTRETIARTRTIGTAMMSYLTEACKRGLCEPSPEEKLADPIDTEQADWSRCPVISHSDLEAKLVPNFISQLPAEDGWGNPLQFCLQRDEGLGRSRGVLGVRSPGSDNRYTGTVYSGGPFSALEHRHDVVWMDGYFATWPVSPEQ
ncbi:MAG: M56 family metallopeptidase [Deltaproteobacteria bacterium]|nr:M56 family metallopeptidase [Deltaproteobacteria bacterium]